MPSMAPNSLASQILKLLDRQCGKLSASSPHSRVGLRTELSGYCRRSRRWTVTTNRFERTHASPGDARLNTGRDRCPRSGPSRGCARCKVLPRSTLGNEHGIALHAGTRSIQFLKKEVDARARTGSKFLFRRGLPSRFVRSNQMQEQDLSTCSKARSPRHSENSLNELREFNFVHHRCRLQHPAAGCFEPKNTLKT